MSVLEKKREGKGENPETKPNPVSPPKPEVAQPALRVASPPARLPLLLSANVAAQRLSAVRSPPPSDKAVPPGSRLSPARSRVASPDPAFPSLTVWARLSARHLPPPVFPAALPALLSPARSAPLRRRPIRANRPCKAHWSARACLNLLEALPAFGSRQFIARSASHARVSRLLSPQRPRRARLPKIPGILL